MERNAKVVLLGPSLVGKTSVVSAYMGGKFSDSSSPTIGASFVNKTVKLSKSTSVKLQIWDTAGQEKFRSLAPMYYHNAQAAIIVFSIADRDSFTDMRTWADELECQTDVRPLVFIVGNKADLEKQRKVETAEGARLAQEIQAKYLETSAKTGVNIEELFWTIASDYDKLAQSQEEQGLDRDVAIEETKHEGCC